MPHSPQQRNTTGSNAALYMALELSGTAWKLGFLGGRGIEKPRVRTIPAGTVDQLRAEIGKARRRLKLADDAPVLSCYEAGRDGFWVHRMLEQIGVSNVVIDPASIEVERKRRARKTDRLDVVKLVTRLVRYHGGEPRVWSVVRIPTEAQEDARRLHRERERLLKEKKQHISRIQSLLAAQGPVPKKLKDATWKRWNGSSLPADLHAELQREQARLDLVLEQLRAVEKERDRRIEEEHTPHAEKTRLLASLRGIGRTSAWFLVAEVYGWRPYENRRKAGSLAGLTGTPYDSGGTLREQGINKAGSGRTRTLLVELAWLWLRYQPQSQLSQWFRERWAGSSRTRRIGIVAMARRLFIDLWRLVEHGVVPPGADFKPLNA